MKMLSLFILLQSGPTTMEVLPMALATVVFCVFVYMLVRNRLLLRRIRKSTSETQSTHQMMRKALDIANNNVIVYDLRTLIVTNLNGHMLPDEGVTEEGFKLHVHPDDVDTVVSGIKQLRTGVRQTIEFGYRWNVNFGAGEPEWRYLRNTSVTEYAPGSRQPINVISALFDETDIHQQQIEEENLSSRYKQIFENSIIGLSFYSPDGWLVDANKIMRDICHFDSEDGDEFFSKSNLFDLFPFNELLDRHHLEEYWGCTQSIIPERNMRVYLEIRLHPICDDHGEIVYLSIATRDITEERELYLQAKRNDVEIQKVNESIQLYETELRYMMEACEMQAWRVSLERNCIEFYNGLSVITKTFTLQQLPHIFLNEDDDFVRALSNPAEAFAKPLVYMGQMKPVVSGKKTEPQWVQINCIPEYDDHGQLIGAFGVWRNINNLMRKQEQLKHETERANDSGRMKSIFLANMTHEIRTPLNAIVGFSDVLPMLTTSEERQEMIRVIMDNCDMLLRLTNDIQTAASLDAGGIQITPVRTDFAHFFNQSCDELRQRIHEPGVEFIKESPYDTYVVDVDVDCIRQILTNFVTNAVKYTHQGHIKLSYQKEWRDIDGNSHEGLCVYCEDTGDGIPVEVQEKIFDRFFKVNDYIQGTGLGLTICKAIADACHGQIGVSSKGQGEGSTFWLWIPCQEIKA